MIARPNQPLIKHLSEAGELCGIFAEPVDLKHTATLLGYFHDFGKYSELFQRYIQSIAGTIPPDSPDYLSPTSYKGKIDHSTAGAQFVWKNSANSPVDQMAAQLIALVIASHHSGLIDCLCPEGTNRFADRMSRPEKQTHPEECESKAPQELLTEFAKLHTSGKTIEELTEQFKSLATCCKSSQDEFDFSLGLLARMCLSCLVDADHSNSAGRSLEPKADWNTLCSLLEKKIDSFTQSSPIDHIRSSISEQCLHASSRPLGTYQLTVPTGGGKTLASLRFALQHAKKHKLERVIYVIPYTSIIDQNAKVVRDILESENADQRNSQVVLEHHSNLTEKNDTERNRLLAENWDSPIVFTTLVQFLESLFSSGTRGVRRMHRLANSVIIFDEAQTLPIKVIHMFNRALNVFQVQWNSTIILCTATQPIFHLVDKSKGALRLSDSPNIIANEHDLFEQLKRVSVSNQCKPGGWSLAQISELIKEQLISSNSLLYIANTKAAAKAIYESVADAADLVVHLSTNMCPAHRKEIFGVLNEALKNKDKKVICISTQLIEAGVDVSFACVLRSIAGLDSIAQAAGRCNRHGEADEKGQVFIINPDFEKLGSLEEIKVAQEITSRILHEFEEDSARFSNDIIGLNALERYYELFYHDRAKLMDFPTERGSLLSMLSSNTNAQQEHFRRNNEKSSLHLNQSFMTANKAFEVIEAATESVVVPFGEQGRSIIGDLSGEIWDPDQARTLRKKAQQYSVNVYPNVMKKLQKANAIHETSQDSGIYYLKEQFYNKTYGLSPEGDGSLAFLNLE